MTKSISVTPYFERGDGRVRGIAETYVAGLRGGRDADAGVKVVLPAGLVERAVLAGARLSISLAPDGRIVLDAEGLDCETIEAASKAAGLSKQTLAGVVTECLRADLLDAEDDPLGDLTKLRAQLVRSLSAVDDAMTRVKGRRKRAPSA